jgi:hypothetical protein
MSMSLCWQAIGMAWDRSHDEINAMGDSRILMSSV